VGFKRPIYRVLAANDCLAAAVLGRLDGGLAAEARSNVRAGGKRHQRNRGGRGVFHDLRVEKVKQGEGWSKIEALPRLFPDA
jgi:hypothetical protein